jgi:molybdopterin molybdotransferase
MISIEEAGRKILERVEVLDRETVPLGEALGRTLAAPIAAADPIPPFDNSAMDGYAVRARETAGATEENPVRLAEIGSIAAGEVPSALVGPGQSMRIMTGAPMPEGADAVVMVEVTSPGGEGQVLISQPVEPRENVRYIGEDVVAGEEIFAAGSIVDPSVMGLAAAVGRAGLEVYRRPRVAIISTGDELTEPGEPLGPGQIHNSNAYSLAGQVLQAGGIPGRLGIARDTEADVRAHIEEALLAYDAVITSGGVSMGDYDVVKSVLTSLGEMVFWQVAVKPGKPLAFGVLKGVPVFGVPGNPAASMVSFEMFVRPSLLKMQGWRDLARPVEEAVFDRDVSKPVGRASVIRVSLERREGTLFASPAGPQGSAILKTMAHAQGLLIVPAEMGDVPAGSRFPVMLLGQSAGGPG